MAKWLEKVVPEKDEPVFPIGVAAKILGVNPRTLKIYEQEGLIKPVKKGNKRYFSYNDLEWLKCLRSFIHEEGISIPGIKKLLELTPCWVIKNCPEEVRRECTAYRDKTKPCWQLVNSACKKMRRCESCEIYLRDKAYLLNKNEKKENNKS